MITQLVCSYFINSALTSIQIWYSYRQPLDYWALIILPSALLVAFDIKTTFFGFFPGAEPAWATPSGRSGATQNARSIP